MWYLTYIFSLTEKKRKERKRKIVFSFFFQLWCSESGKILQTFEGHTDGVNYAEFTDSDKKIVSCSSDNSIKVWSIGGLWIVLFHYNLSCSQKAFYLEIIIENGILN